MSWAAHDLEGYVFQRHLSRGVRISFVAFVIGSWGPDLLTKWFVYGVDFGGINLGAGDPTVFARGWPGAGMTHSLARPTSKQPQWSCFMTLCPLMWGRGCAPSRRKASTSWRIRPRR